MLREASAKGDVSGHKTTEATLLNPDSDDSAEKIENVKEIIHSILFFEVTEEPASEIRVKLSDKDRPAVEFMIRNNTQFKEQFANISSQELIKIALEFFLSYAKYLLYRIRDYRSNGDLKFVSGSLKLGMWSSIAASDDFKDFDNFT